MKIINLASLRELRSKAIYFTVLALHQHFCICIQAKIGAVANGGSAYVFGVQCKVEGQPGVTEGDGGHSVTKSVSVLTNYPASKQGCFGVLARFSLHRNFSNDAVSSTCFPNGTDRPR